MLQCINAPEEDNGRIQNLLQRTVIPNEKCNKTDQVITMGDFNGRIGNIPILHIWYGATARVSAMELGKKYHCLIII